MTHDEIQKWLTEQIDLAESDGVPDDAKILAQIKLLLRRGEEITNERQGSTMKYRKKPVVVEAFQMTKERRNDRSEWPAWLVKASNLPQGTQNLVAPIWPSKPNGRLMIVTLEGSHTVSWDDFIIQGVQGELYPCKPDIFHATYDLYRQRADYGKPF